MHSGLNRYLAKARIDDLRRASVDSALARRPRLSRRIDPTSPVTLRFAFPDDEEAVARLATLDSSPVPTRPVLLAEIAGELRAAASLADGAMIADPFYPSSAVIELLRARARQLQAVESRRRLPRLRPRARLA